MKNNLITIALIATLSISTVGCDNVSEERQAKLDQYAHEERMKRLDLEMAKTNQPNVIMNTTDEEMRSYSNNTMTMTDSDTVEYDQGSYNHQAQVQSQEQSDNTVAEQSSGSGVGSFVAAAATGAAVGALTAHALGGGWKKTTDSHGNVHYYDKNNKEQPASAYKNFLKKAEPVKNKAKEKIVTTSNKFKESRFGKKANSGVQKAKETTKNAGQTLIKHSKNAAQNIKQHVQNRNRRNR